jgi:hypothetical protein
MIMKKGIERAVERAVRNQRRSENRSRTKELSPGCSISAADKEIANSFAEAMERSAMTGVITVEECPDHGTPWKSSKV